MTPYAMAEKARGLRDQAAYLMDPERKQGPAMQEAGEAAGSMLREADQLDCDAFYSPTVKHETRIPIDYHHPRTAMGRKGAKRRANRKRRTPKRARR